MQIIKGILSCLMFFLISAGAFAGSFGELQNAVPGALEERIPAFETPIAAPAADAKHYDYNFRCIAGPATPQYTAPVCYLYTARGQQACESVGCNWAFGETPIPSFHCEAAYFTPPYTAPACYTYTARGQQACQSVGCYWAFGETPIPSFHCVADSFTPPYTAPVCYIYTARGQQACVNAGCSWTFGTK